MSKLPKRFYERDDVTLIAKELLGKIIVTVIKGVRTSGRIVETEAYAGISDRASHAYGGRRTARTEVMYGKGGTAYVYLCYGIHHLFNVVTHRADVPHAVLIRGIEPLSGVREMLRRTGKEPGDLRLGRGPGNVSKALGITVELTGASLYGHQIYIDDDGYRFKDTDVLSSPRIGVDYAGKDALLPYRYSVKG